MRKRLEKVIRDATVASNLLPRERGFFFGSTEYDEEYLNDVVATRDWIVRTLKDNHNGVEGNITYHASW